MIGNIQAIEVQIPHEIVQYWGWFLVFGIGLLTLGIAAVVRSVLATVATMLFYNRQIRSYNAVDGVNRSPFTRRVAITLNI